MRSECVCSCGAKIIDSNGSVEHQSLCGINVDTQRKINHILKDSF